MKDKYSFPNPRKTFRRWYEGPYRMLMKGMGGRAGLMNSERENLLVAKMIFLKIMLENDLIAEQKKSAARKKKPTSSSPPARSSESL